MLEKQLFKLGEAIGSEDPCFSGTLPVPASAFVLYYGRKGATERVDLSDATVKELEQLTKVCDAATFGRDEKDVLDESYRKAGKMDSQDFLSGFNVLQSGLVDQAREMFLKGHDSGRGVRAELYKLNVYGKGSFFKAHKDTPRGTDMFGSVVVVFPTPHEGGALLLRHEGKEWTHDHGNVLSQHGSTPMISYSAFFSDVEHEVAMVTSGHRVTLTYNLYFDSGDQVMAPVPIVPSENESQFTKTLGALLADETFLPEGGLLAFGLSHQYPLVRGSESRKALSKMIHRLKASDAIVARALRSHSLVPRLRMVYSEYPDSMRTVMVNAVLEDDDGLQGSVDSGGAWRMIETHESEAVEPYDYVRSGDDEPDEYVRAGPIDYEDCWEEGEASPMYWVTKGKSLCTSKTLFAAYRNEVSLESMYGDPILVVRLGEAGERSVPVKREEDVLTGPTTRWAKDHLRETIREDREESQPSIPLPLRIR